ncbi:MAG: DUF4347 domain-containing protein [Desulfamplus sp.]|nr:DUF4347 domain-containing protein [Desulfamplus sp.]
MDLLQNQDDFRWRENEIEKYMDCNMLKTKYINLKTLYIIIIIISMVVHFENVYASVTFDNIPSMNTERLWYSSREIQDDGKDIVICDHNAHIYDCATRRHTVEVEAGETHPIKKLQTAIIDTQVTDFHLLEQAAIEAGMEVILLSGQGDGLAELAAALAGRSGIEALHILSHGSSGQIILGQASLNSDSLDDYADELALIRQALSEDGDILLYGCKVAEGQTGMEFVSRLAQITGADVAVSDDLTGAAALGGDWDLELTQGQVETSSIAIANYAGTLAAPEITLTTTPGGSSLIPGLGLAYNSIDAINTATHNYVDIVYGDFDGDGDMDLVGAIHAKAPTDKSSVYLYTNDGSQNFTKTEILSGLDYAAQVIAGDIDDDGDIDVIVADATNGSGNGRLSVLKNSIVDGIATFTETIIGTNLEPSWMEIADLDGDGRKDIVFTTADPAKMNWAKQNVDGSFTHTVIGDNGGRNSLVVTDFDGDGHQDIVSTDEAAGKVYLWTNNHPVESFTRTVLGSFSGASSNRLLKGCLFRGINFICW